MRVIKEVWPYAYHAYDSRKEVVDRFGPLETMVEIGYDRMFAAIDPANNRLIIAFRGTDTTGHEKTFKQKVKVWLSNIKAFRMKDSGGQIHDGFYDAWKPFKGLVKGIVSRNGGLDVFCTGHSRGGALSVLCARHIAKNLGVPCNMIAFGAPLVGDKHFRNEYVFLPIHSTRVINGNDIVPKMPPEAMGFRNESQVVKFETWLPAILVPAIFEVAYHMPDAYNKKISKIP